MTDLRRRLPRRLIQLYAGLVTFAFGEALIVQARLGVMSWDVLHQGLTKHLGLSIGQWSIIVGALVLLLWIPMREKPGLGTFSNVIVIGASLDLFLRWVPVPTSLGWRVALLLLGIVINGVATAAYIGARLGPGPRDGLMTGLVRLTRWSVGWIRTGIEVSVVAIGYLLGGNLNAGTVLFVLTIGPIVHVFLPKLTVGGPVTDH
ncbi:MAG: membrane protein YczE [Dermatophilaceae bacterium]